MELDEDVEGPGPKKRYSSDNPFASAAPAAANYSADNPFAGGATGTAVAEPEVPTARAITALPPATPPEQVESAKALFAQPPALRGARQPVPPLPTHPLTTTVAQDVTAVPGVLPSIPALPSPSLGVTPSPALGAAAPISAEEAGAAARGLEHPILNIARALGRDVGARFLLQGAQKIADVVGSPAGLEANPLLRQVVDVANRQRAAEQAGKPHAAAELSRSLIEMLGEMELLPGATAESGVAAPKVLAELGGETAAKAIPALANAGADVTGAITENVPGTVAGRIARRAAEEAGRMGYVEGATGSVQEPDLEKASERLRSGALGGLLWGAGTQALGEAASAGVKTALGKVAERNLPRRPIEEMSEPEPVPVERRLGAGPEGAAAAGKAGYSPDNPFTGGSPAATAAPEAPKAPETPKTEPPAGLESYLQRVGINQDHIDEILGRKEPPPFNERAAERRAAEAPKPPEGVEERRKTGRRAEPGAGELPNVPIEELPPFEQKATVSKAVEQKPTVEQAGAGRPSEVAAPEAASPPERTSPATAAPEKKGRQRKPSYAVEGSNPKYGKMSNEELEDRYLELTERAEAAGMAIQKGVTPWTRDDPNMDIDAPGTTKRSGVSWSGAAGRAKGASDVAGRLMGEVESEMKVRKIDQDGVLERAEERRALQGDTNVPEYERGKESVLGQDFRKQLVDELVKSGHPKSAVTSLDDRKLAGLASDLPSLTPPQESRIMDVIYGARSTLVGDKRRRYGKAPVPEPASLELTSEAEPAKPDQESLFGEKEGTAASRSLKQTEAASKSELEVLRTRLEREKAPARRQSIATQVADLEKLVNRDKAITAGEMATRAAADEATVKPGGLLHGANMKEQGWTKDTTRGGGIAELADMSDADLLKNYDNLRKGRTYAVRGDIRQIKPFREEAKFRGLVDGNGEAVSQEPGESENASGQPTETSDVTTKTKSAEEDVSRGQGGGVSESGPTYRTGIGAERGPGFRSRLVESVSASKIEKAPAQTWVSKLRGKGNSADEFDWALGHALDADPKKQWTRDELTELAKQRGYGALTETVRGAKPGTADLQTKYSDAETALSGATTTWWDHMEGKSGQGPLPDRRDALNARNALIYDAEPVDQVLQSYEIPDTPEIRKAATELRRRGIDLRDAQRALDAVGTKDAKYGNYAEPGGKNYREILLQVPGKFKTADEIAREMYGKGYTSALSDEQQAKVLDEMDKQRRDFTSGHWEEPNVLAHIRLNDRTAANGDKVLHVEEIQSDWHQKGRRQGYVPSGTSMLEKVRKAQKDADALTAQIGPLTDQLVAALREEDNLGFDYASQALGAIRTHDDYATRWEMSPETKALAEEWRPTAMRLAALRRAAERSDLQEPGVPDAPFKETPEWLGLAMKRVLDEAVAHHYDAVTWTPGEKQADRYSLRKVADKVIYSPKDEGLVVSKGSEIIHRGRYDSRALADVIGKEAAERLLATKPEIVGKGTKDEVPVHTLEGEGLEVGGHGMKSFYDKLLPEWLQSYGKKLGVPLEPTDITTDGKTKNATTNTEIKKTLKAMAASGKHAEDEYTAEEAAAAERVLHRWADGRTIGSAVDGIGEDFPLVAEQMERDFGITAPVFPGIKITPELKAALGKGQSLGEPKPVTGYDVHSDDASQTFGSAEKATDAAQLGLWADERLPTMDERRKVVERAPRTWVDVRGKRLATPEDAAVLLRPFRNPLTETMHFILKSEDDIVLAHTMETSGAVDKVAYVGDAAFGRMIQDLVDRARRLGATKIDMAHNHPSGNPHPSESDLRFTAQVSGEIREAAKKADLPLRLNRHYVIDHEAMTEISIKSSTELPEGWKTELVLHGGIKVPATGIDWTARTDHAIKMPADVLRLVGAPVADRVDVVYRDTQGRVVAIAPHARAALKTMATWLPAEAKSLGAENAILVVGTDETLFKEAHQAAGKYKGARRIEDVVAIDKAGAGDYRSAGESGLYSPHVSDDVRSARRLAEEPGDYHTGRLQPEESVLPAAEGGTEDVGHPARNAVDLALPKLPDLSSEAGFLKIGPIPTNLSGLYKALSETDVGDSIVKLFAPASRSPEAARMGHIVRAKRGEAERDYVIAKWALRQAIEEAPRLSTPEGLAFTDAIEAGKIGTLPSNLQPIAKALRAVLDDRRQKVQALGGSALKDFIENYFPHIWDKGAKGFLSRLMSRRPLEGSKSFLKHRTVPTIREGVEGLKLVPMTDNPVSMVLLKIREMDKYIAAHRIWNDAKKEKLVHFFRIGAKRPDGWSKIEDRIATVFAPPTDEGAMAIRGEYYAPDPVATILNNTVSPGLRGNVLYDAFAGAGSMLNQAQLGLSFFHAGFTTYDVMVSHLAMAIEDLVDGRPGQALKTLPSAIHAVGTNPLRGWQVRMEYRNPGSSKDPQMQQIVNALVRGGMRAEQPMEYDTNAMERFAREIRQHPLKMAAKAVAGGAAGAVAAGPVGAIVGAGLASKALPAALEWASGGIMKHLVPLQKNGVMAELMRRALERLGPDATQAQIDAAAADVVDTVEDRLGQVTYDNYFWDRRLKDILQLGIRSVGWNAGYVRLVPGGVKDITAGRWKTYSATYIMALAIMTGLTGTMIYWMLHGKEPESLKDLVYVPTGEKNEDGEEERMVLPSYMRDVGAFTRHPLTTLEHKLNPLFAMVHEGWTNRDFYGNEIRNEDDPGVQQIQQVAEYIAKQFIPFGIRNAVQEGQQGQGIVGKLLPFIGVTPAPREVVRSPDENIMARYYERRGRPALTPEEADKSQQRRTAHGELRDLTRAPDAGTNDKIPEYLEKKVASGEMTAAQAKAALRTAGEPPHVKNFRQLPLDVAMRAYQAATPERRADYYQLFAWKIQGAEKTQYDLAKKADGMLEELDHGEPTAVSGGHHRGPRPPTRHR